MAEDVKKIALILRPKQNGWPLEKLFTLFFAHNTRKFTCHNVN